MTTKMPIFSFRLLEEDASAEDLFDQKTHESVAIAISSLIETADKSVTIGIEGAWGSGKSTVVRLLKNKIQKNTAKKTLFFPFDAWAHEGDPLRRIFLESLISTIDPGDKDPLLVDLKRQITGRKKTVKVRSGTRASRLGFWITVLALFVPAGAAMLSAVDGDQVLPPWHAAAGEPNLMFVFGLLFSMFPLLYVLVWSLCGEVDKDTGKRKWDYFESRSREEYTQDITEDGERTSVEFEGYFEKVLGHALDAHGMHKFDRAVVIVDNLDRVDARQALALWSTLQTFFKYKSNLGDATPEWRNRVWFLVPHDRDGLERVWSESNSSIGKSFLDKCFQVRFEVPEPVMTGWYAYLCHCVRVGLVGWPEEAKQAVVSTFQRYFSRINESPTPRKIQNFVNQTGVLGMRWGGVNKPESIALYAALRQENSERQLRSSLISNTFPMELNEIGEEFEIRMELAGMLFGVPKEKGMQLLLAPLIKKALTEGDGKYLDELSQMFGEGFWIAWNAERSTIIPTGSHFHEHLVPSTHAIAGGLGRYGPKIHRSLREIAASWKTAGGNWKLGELEFEAAFRSLMEHYPKNDQKSLVDWLYNVIEERISHAAANIGSEEVDAHFLLQLHGFAGLLNEYGLPILTGRRSELDAAGWIVWDKKCSEAKVDLSFVLPADGVLATIAADMVNSNADILKKDHLKALKKALSIDPKLSEARAIANTLAAWGVRESKESGNSAAFELMYMLQCLSITKVSSVIHSCIKNPTFWSSEQSVDSGGYLPLLAAVSLTTELQGASYIPTAIKKYWLEENASQDVLESVQTKFLLGKKLPLLLELATDRTMALAQHMLTKNIDNELLYEPNYAVLNFSSYSSEGGVNKEALAIALCERGLFERSVPELSQNIKDYDQDIYEILEFSKGSCSPHVQKMLDGITEADWLSHIHDNSWLLNCVIYPGITTTHHYRHALKGELIRALAGELELDGWIWDHLVELIEKAQDRELLAEDIVYSYLVGDEDKLNEAAFSAVSSVVARHISAPLEERLMDRVDYWLENSMFSRCKWFVHAKLKLTKKPLEYLVSRITDLLNEMPEGEEKAVVRDVAAALQVEIPVSKNPSVAGSEE